MANPRVETVVRAVVSLAAELGLTVVAEGVTDAHTVARLIAWDVGIAQGDYLGVPVQTGDVPGLIRRSAAGLGVAP
jgi:EAL domain-containing protein (putative c-di-GMP-specific phosphodiesterase class I)